MTEKEKKKTTSFAATCMLEQLEDMYRDGKITKGFLDEQRAKILPFK